MTSRSSDRAPGSSAATGERSRRATPSTSSTRPSTPASPSSTPRTCTETAAANSSSAATSRTAPTLDIFVATKMGRRVGPAAGELRPGQLPYLERPFPRQPRRRHPRPGTAALPAHQRLLLRRGLRRPRHPGRRAADRGLRGERRDLRRGADRHRPARRRERADHPQPVPSQAPGRGPSGGAQRRASASSRASRSPPGCCPASTPRTPSSAADDHRTYNRHGEAFDQGETFSGIDYATGVEAAAEFAALAPEGATPAQTALRWIIQQPGVTTVIPGARSVEQARANAAAAALPPLPQSTLDAVRELYDRSIRAEVHSRW